MSQRANLPYPIGMILRDATADDLDLVVALHSASWRRTYAGLFDPAYLARDVEPERRRHWTARFASRPPHQRIVIAEAEGEPIGFACIVGNEHRRWGTLLDNLHVAAEAQGRGLGASLLRTAAGWSLERWPAAGLHLLVYERNESARRFYERMGGAMVDHFDEEAPDGRSLVTLRYAWSRNSPLFA